MKKYLARSFFFLLYQFIPTRTATSRSSSSPITPKRARSPRRSSSTRASPAAPSSPRPIRRRWRSSRRATIRRCGTSTPSIAPTATTSTPTIRRRCARAKELAEVCNLFGYGEIKPLGSRYYESSMLNIFRRLDAEHFQTVLIERKEDIWPSFKAFLAKDRQAPTSADGSRSCQRRYELQDLETWDARIREKVAGVRARLLPARVRDLRPQPDAGVHGVLRHAVALPALVVRQVLREAEDALRLRRLRHALRDGHQLQPGARVPDARQLAAAADPDHRPRLRAQRLLQEQFHLQDHARRVHHRAPSRRTATACAPTSKNPSIGLEKVEAVLDAAHAVSLQCRRNLAVRKRTPTRSAERLLDAAQPADRPVPAHSPPPRSRRARPAQGAARRPTRICCCSSATTIRSWPSGRRTC